MARIRLKTGVGAIPLSMSPGISPSTARRILFDVWFKRLLVGGARERELRILGVAAALPTPDYDEVVRKANEAIASCVLPASALGEGGSRAAAESRGKGSR